MPALLRLLHVEDSAEDAELVRLALEDGGYELRCRRVETARELEDALATEPWDLMISDFNLPVFSAAAALQMLHDSRRDIPFILVSGCIGEERAVAMMKAGVHDYVMKDNLHRLVPAVGRELREADERRRRRQAEMALQDSEKQLRELSQYLQAVREEDRAHFARELHDELGQALTALGIDLNWLGEKLAGTAPPVGAKLAAMEELLAKTVDAVRRICEDLRPGMLDDLGLEAALEHHAQKFSGQTGIACDLAMERDDYGLDSQTSTAIFRIFQEALTNVARHAAAKRVAAALEERDGAIVLTVTDDGRGLPAAPPTGRKTYGLLGMRERVKMLGGRFAIDSAPGQGTRIEVSLPKRAEARGL